MSIRRSLAIARKEFRHIFRDLRICFLVTVSPAFLLLTLSYIFAFDVEQANLAVWDLDDSQLSREYVASLTADGDFRVRYHVDSYDALDSLLLSGQADGALVIPAGFEEGLRAGRQVQVQAAIDGVDPIAGSQSVSALRQRSAAFSARFRAPQPVAGGLDLRSEALYNPALNSLLSMVPGLTAVVLCLPALALALALAREKETGSFESLIATPIRGSEYLVGKLSAYIVSGLISVLLAWLVAVLYFRVPFRSDLPGYLLLASVYLLAGMAFSLVIANFVRSQQTAMFLVLMVFFVPSFFVSGLITPVDTSNLGSQLVAYALPATHFIGICRGMFLKGLGVGPLRSYALALAAMGLGGLLFSLVLFRKRLK